MKKIVIYARSSTRKTESDTTSSQLQELYLWAVNNDYVIVGAYQDLQSGRDAASREGLQEALQTAQIHDCPVAAVEVSRLTRSIADMGAMIRNQQEFLFSRMGRTMGKEMVLLACLLGEFESDAISRRVSAGIQNAFQRNPELRANWGGAQRPKQAAADMQRGRVKKADSFALRVGPIAAEMRATGKTLRQVAQLLTNSGVKTARGGDKWSAEGVRTLVDRYSRLIVTTDTD